jgi:hypothetical protein
MPENKKASKLPEIMAQIGNVWKELREIIVPPPANSNLNPDDRDFQTTMDRRFRDEERSARENGFSVNEVQPENQTDIMKILKINSKVTPEEKRHIIQRYEEIYHSADYMILGPHADILERLAKIEKNNRKILFFVAIYSSILIIMICFFTFILFHPNLINKKTLQQTMQSAISTDKAPSQVVTDNSQKGEAIFKYVGSKTSNKYHYPDCKWTGKIAPERLITFKSVAEAQEEGYVPCPTCKPPLTDETINLDKPQ